MTEAHSIGGGGSARLRNSSSHSLRNAEFGGPTVPLIGLKRIEADGFLRGGRMPAAAVDNQAIFEKRLLCEI
nr:hypothetical protein [Paraburkholderia xenovorans]